MALLLTPIFTTVLQNSDIYFHEKGNSKVVLAEENSFPSDIICDNSTLLWSTSICQDPLRVLSEKKKHRLWLILKQHSSNAENINHSDFIALFNSFESVHILTPHFFFHLRLLKYIQICWQTNLLCEVYAFILVNICFLFWKHWKNCIFCNVLTKNFFTSNLLLLQTSVLGGWHIYSICRIFLSQTRLLVNKWLSII